MAATSWSERIRAVVTSPVPESGSPLRPVPTGVSFTADGVTMSAGPPADHVLLLAQAHPALNGPWVYAGQGDPMTRPTDFDGVTMGTVAPTAAVTVTAGPEGTTYKYSRWRATWPDSSSTVNTNDPMFAREDGLVDIRLFGAKCDGSTDDSVAVQAACDFASQINGRF